MGFLKMLRGYLISFWLPSGFFNKTAFKEDNIRLALNRLKIFLSFVLFSLCLVLAADFTLFRGLWSGQSWRNLVASHIICVATATELLIALFYFSKKPLSAARYFCRFAIFLILFVSAGFTLLNLRISGNIYIYIIAILSLGFIFPVNPIFFTILFSSMQAVFMFGLQIVPLDPYNRLFHQFNSITAAVVATAINIFLYRSRVRDFIKNTQIKVGEEYFRHMMGASSQPLLVINYGNGQLLFANESAQDYFGLRGPGLSDNSHIKGMYKDSGEWDRIMTLLKGQGVIHGYVAEQRTIKGERKWTTSYYTIIEYLGKQAILCEFTDITRLKEQELSLISDASSDPLTGIFNRRKGMELLEKAVQDTQNSDGSFVLCFLDIDGLKKINDTYGHAKGDYIIVSICRTIADFLDREDVFFRYGGDEFIILFMNKTLSEAKSLYRRMEEQFKTPGEMNLPYSISISSGFSECRAGEHTSCERLLERADNEMYRQKRERAGENAATAKKT